MKKLLSPDGTPVINADRVMLLNKWAHYVAESAPREVAMSGMGRPSFPVNKTLTNAEMGFWGSISEKGEGARRILKAHERSLKQRKSNVENPQSLTSPLSSPKGTSPQNEKAPGVVGQIVKKIYALPFEVLKRIREGGSAAVEYTEASGEKKSRVLIADGLSRFYGLQGENSIHFSDVMFTVGGASALYTIFQAINANRPKGRIVTTNPYYSLHAGAQHSNRLHTIDVMKLRGYRLTASALRKEILIAKERAKLDGGKISAFVFCYPNNPTGQILNAEEWEEIAQVIREDKDLSDVRIILDEAYAELQLNGEDHISLYQVAPDLRQRIILIRSSTKALSAAGERMGVVVCKDHAFLEQLEGIQTEILGHASKSGNHAYAAAMDALSEGEQLRLIAWYKPMVDFVAEGLRLMGAQMPDIHYQVQGTFYVMANLKEFIGTPIDEKAKLALPDATTIRDDEDLVYHLLFKEQLMVAPLSYFGVDAKEGFVRITCSDVKHVEDLVIRLTKALTELRQEKIRNLLPLLNERLHALNQVSPQVVAKMAAEFNALLLGNIRVTPKNVVCTEGNLTPLAYQQLFKELHDIYLSAGAELKKNSIEGKNHAANVIKRALVRNVQRHRTERFSQSLNTMWCLWVDNFVDEEYRLEKKSRSPNLASNNHPKWALFHKALLQEYVTHDYHSDLNAKSFDVTKFAQTLITQVKAADKKYEQSLLALFDSGRQRSSSDEHIDTESSPRTDSTESEPVSVKPGSSLSSSPTESGNDTTLKILLNARKQSLGLTDKGHTEDDPCTIQTLQHN